MPTTLDVKLLVLQKKTAAFALLRAFQVDYERFLADRVKANLLPARDGLLATLDTLEDASTDAMCVAEELPVLAKQTLGGDWSILFPLICDTLSDIRRFCRDAGIPLSAPPSNYLENMQRVISLSSPDQVERLRTTAMEFELPVVGFPNGREQAPSQLDPVPAVVYQSCSVFESSGDPVNPIKAFVTYSWDTKDHEEKVQALAGSLRGDGIECDIDKFDHVKAEGLPRWMGGKLSGARFVLCVCTESYCRRFEGREERGKGLGANFEGKLISQAIYEAGGKNEKFIPVVFSPSDAKHIPEALKGAIYYTLDSQSGYEDLYRRLTGQPSDVPPPVGPLRKLPQREGLRLFMPAGSGSTDHSNQSTSNTQFNRVGAESDFAPDASGAFHARWRLTTDELKPDEWLDVRVRLEVLDANGNLLGAGDWVQARGYAGRWETQRVSVPVVPSVGSALMIARVESNDRRFTRTFEPRQFTNRIW